MTQGPQSPFPGGKETVVWHVADLLRGRASAAEVRGSPRIISGPERREAVEFDGVNDGIVMPANPLRGWRAFVVEALFNPYADGPVEQRFLHVHVGDATTDRLLLETRMPASPSRLWYADTVASSGGCERIIVQREKVHATNAWHVLAVVCDGTRMLQYVNGQLEHSLPFEFEPLGEGCVCLGMRLNRVTPFRGALAAVRFVPLQGSGGPGGPGRTKDDPC